MSPTKPNLSNFYNVWSSKSGAKINFDTKYAVKKAETISNNLPNEVKFKIKTVLDYGCGYGAFLNKFADLLNLEEAVGVDYSEEAIRVANDASTSENVKFKKLNSLNISDNIDAIKKLFSSNIDCITLIDFLEHIPDCRTALLQLSELCTLFIIKLPVEESIFDNYILKKEYPGILHSNGHLREFNVNNVYYFIRKIGLTPLYESLYLYDINETLPLQADGVGFKRRLSYFLVKIIKIICKQIMPKKIFMKVIGGGGYYCVATFNKELFLNES